MFSERFPPVREGSPAYRAGVAWGFFALAAWWPSAYAQEVPPVDDTIVVTASRLQQPASDAIPDTTVITRADIEQSQAHDLTTLLAQQAGVEIARSGGFGSQTSLFLRGTNSNQVLVLVDGVPLNNSLSGAPTLGGISTDSIERIEIVRGNLSSLYGSEAIGGVIQIFTRAASHPGAQVQADAGQGGTRDANASVSTKLGSAMLTASAGTSGQNAISAQNPAQLPGANPGLDGNNHRDGSLRLAGDAGSDQYDVWVWGNRNDTYFDNYFDGPTSIHLEHATLQGYGASDAHHFGQSVVQVQVAQTRDNSVDVSNVPTSFSNGVFYSSNQLASVQDTTPITAGVDFNGGLEHELQTGSSNQYDPTGNNAAVTTFQRHIDSAWVGFSGHHGTQQWQANVRHDQYSDFGGATTGLLGWGWRFLPEWRLTAQASSAFRAPSFNDLYYPYSGNPALQPERARSEEVGVHWQRASTTAGLTVYRTRITNLIDYLAPNFVATNIGRAAINGAELAGSWSWWRLRFEANFNADRPRDQITGQPLLRRADYYGNLGVSYADPLWNGQFDIRRTGARNDTYTNPATFSSVAEQLAPYTLARLAVERVLTPNVRLQLRVENLFNAHYQMVYGYNTLPRLIIAGVEARL